MADLKPRIILLERVPPKLESFFFFSRPSSFFSFKRNYPLGSSYWLFLKNVRPKGKCSLGDKKMFAGRQKKCSPRRFAKNLPSECSCMNRQRDDSEIFKIDLIILEDNIDWVDNKYF